MVLKKVWKYGLITLAVMTLGFAAFFAILKNAHATNGCNWSGENQESCQSGEDKSVGGQNVNVNNNNNNENKNINKNGQSQSQENHQEVNLTVNNTQSATTTSSVPVKQPETGAGVLGLMSMFSAGPAGLYLVRYRKK